MIPTRYRKAWLLAAVLAITTICQPCAADLQHYWHTHEPNPTSDSESICPCNDSLGNNHFNPGSAAITCDDESASVSWYISSDNYSDAGRVDGGSRTIKFSYNSAHGVTPPDFAGTVNYVNSLCSSCQGCSCGNGSGDGDNDVGSIRTRISLGRTTSGDFAGALTLAANQPSLILATPAGLNLLNPANDVEEIRDNENTNALHQVMTLECLVDIVTNSAFKYSINFYHSKDVESELDSNGCYVAKSGVMPFCVWIVENPAASTNDFNSLRVSRIGGETNVAEYSFMQDTNGVAEWSLSTGNGLKYQSKSTYSNGVDGVTIAIIKDGNQVIASKVRETYRKFSWGEVIVERMNDPDGAALAQSISYYTDEEESNKYSKVYIETGMDGTWKRYDYEEQGRQSLVISSWQDATTNASADEARAVYYSYESAYPYYLTTNTVYTNAVVTNTWVTNGITNNVVETNAVTNLYVITNVVDNGTVKPLSPRTTTEKILGNVVSKTYNVYYQTVPGDRVEIEEKCADANTVFGASSNLRTEKVYNLKSSTAASSERIKSASYPDGRKDTYTYEYGVYTTNADPAQCSFTANATTGEYVRVTCVHGATDNPDGIANKSTKEVTIENLAGRTVMQETYAYSGDSSYTRIAWVVYFLDDSGRPTDIWKSNGSHSETTWGCCGKEWEKDENGVEYSYTYDALKRVTQKVKSGIAAGAYPAQADQYTTYTYDAEGRQLTAVVSASGLSQGRTNQYDLAGRLTNSSDFAGLVSATAYSQDGLTTTETLPGGYTRITEHYKDGQVKNIAGTSQMAQYYEYGVSTNGGKWTTVYSASNNSPVWVKSTADLLGRTAKIEKPGYSGTETTEYVYNSKGQLVKTTTTGQPDTLYAYDEGGNQIQSGLDVNANGSLDLAGTDRISESEISYTQINNDWWKQTVSRLYATDNSATPITNSITRQRLTGFTGNLISENWSLNYNGNETLTTVTVDRNSKTFTRTVDMNDSVSNGVSVTVNGLIQNNMSKSGVTSMYSYDALNRQTGIADARSGTVIMHYDSRGWMDYMEDSDGHRTGYSYDLSTGRKLSQTDRHTNVTYYAYTSHGLTEKTWGSAIYPTWYEYDGYDRLIKMHTYRSGSGFNGNSWPSGVGDGDVTEWICHESSGLITAKKDAAGKQVSYTYTTGGTLASRTWSRADGTNSLSTTYSYSTNGDLTGIDYSDATPDVSFTYDRFGRQITAASSVSAHTFAYNGLLLDTETIVSDGGTNVIDRSYDSYGRPTGFSLGSDYLVAYGYDSVGRFAAVSSSVQSASSVVNYSYLANADLISELTSDLGPLTSRVTRSYEDHRNLLTQVKNEIDTTTISQYDYINDNEGRRTLVKHSGAAFETGSAFNRYGYNSRSEIVTSDRYWGANLNDTSDPVESQSFAYGYDNIGNRTSSLRENDEMDYTANNLNQYTQRTIPAVIDVLGSAETNTTVTVNDLATSRHGMYWYKGLSVTNDSSAIYQEVNVVGVYNPPDTNDPDIVTSVTGHVFVAQTPEAFTYDDDGNLQSDGRFAYSWDAENRLIGAETLTNLPFSVPRVKLEFAYDYMSRRASKTVYIWNSSSNEYQVSSVNQFIYDGWNLLREIASTPIPPYAVTNSYVWGLDLSGSLQGAGGIGGLLSAKLGTNNVCYTYDANGNVSELISDLGYLAAHYEYSPFGETIVATGPLAKDNPFRFSTKYTDDESGLLYYGYRYYTCSLGRWLSRDPKMEFGFKIGQDVNTRRAFRVARDYMAASLDMLASGFGKSVTIANAIYRLGAQLRSLSYEEFAVSTINLYNFVHNDPVNLVDILGLLDGDPNNQPWPPNDPPPDTDGSSSIIFQAIWAWIQMNHAAEIAEAKKTITDWVKENKGKACAIAAVCACSYEIGNYAWNGTVVVPSISVPIGFNVDLKLKGKYDCKASCLEDAEATLVWTYSW